MQEIDIEKIMEEIRQDIRERGLEDDILPFEAVTGKPWGGASEVYDEERFEKEVNDLNQSYQITAWRPLEGGITGFIKKIIRKLTKFYVEPITADQTEFNAHTVRAMNELLSYVKLQDAKMDALQEEIRKLKKKKYS